MATPFRKTASSFQEFGWDLVEAFRAAGFADAQAEFCVGPPHGHFSFTSPMIVGYRGPAA